MSFNIEVVNTGSLTVQLARRHLKYDLTTISENEPNHVYDEVVIDKIFMSIFEKLSTVTQPVYHRLKYVISPGPSLDFTNLWEYARPANSALERFIDLVPDALHTPVAGGFSVAENHYLVGPGTHTLAHKSLGKFEKRMAVQDFYFTFDLQYQLEPTPLTPVGRNPDGVWVSYNQNLATDIVVAGGVSGELQLRLRTAYTDDNYNDPVEKVTRLYQRRPDYAVLGADSTLPASIELSGTTYTSELGNSNTYPIQVLQILYTDHPTYAVARAEVDYVLLLSDDNASGSKIDDIVYVTSPQKNPVNIQEHLLFSVSDPTPIDNGPAASTTVNVKVFRGKTTRIYTDLIWPNVGVNSANPDATDVSDSSNSKGNFGFWDYDNGGTRLGITIDANKRVYIIIKLGVHSTSLLFENFDIKHGNVATNPFDGIGPETTFFDAPSAYDSANSGS